MKKILLLGGSEHQVSAIEKAKSRGYYTILCDYIPENPGRRAADEYHCISTTEKELILELAREKEIDGILAYASDPAVLTAAYVSKMMRLPCNPYESILILSRKDLFRKFLKENRFNCPNSAAFKTYKEACDGLQRFRFPVMVKPVDSSGSKGISFVRTAEGFETSFHQAMEKSKAQLVIVEEYIDMAHECMIGGDGFIIDDKLVFRGFLNSHRDPAEHSLVPVGTSYPPFVGEDKLDRARKEIQRLISLLGIRMGAINIEVMFDSSDNLYIIEIGARNGGNMIPELLDMISGADLISAGIESCLGNRVEMEYEFTAGYYSAYVIHSNKKGIMLDIRFSDEIKDNILKKVQYKKNNSQIDIFNSADKAIGILFLKFDSLDELKYKMKNMNKFIEIVIE